MSIRLAVFLSLILFYFNGPAYAQTYVFAKLQGPNVNTSGWDLTGSSSIGNIKFSDNSEIILCNASNWETGSIFYNQPINLAFCKKWTAEFDFRIYDGTGADGIAFCFLDVPPSGFVVGGGMGIPQTANGLKVCFDQNPNCYPYDRADMPKIEIRWGNGYDECWAQPTKDNRDGSLSFIRSDSYNHAKITYDNGNISVYVNDTLYLEGFQQFNFTGYLGFTSATGALNDDQSIRNAIIYTDMPPSEAGNDQTICSGRSIQIGSDSNPNYIYKWTPLQGLNSSTISNPTLTISNNSGSNIVKKYFVRTALSNLAGCSSMDSVTITVTPALPVSIFVTASDTSILTGKPVTFTAATSNLQPPITYQWYKNNQPVGNNSNVYADYNLYNNDSLWVSASGNNSCNNLVDTLSNKVRITVNVCSEIAEIDSASATICSGQTYRLPWGVIVSTPGLYSDTLHYQAGCDSLIRQFRISLNIATVTGSNIAICSGQTYTLPSGKVISGSGIYYDTLHYSAGCDSIIQKLQLTVLQPTAKTNNVTICNGHTYTLPSGRIVASSGIYTDTLRYLSGCDSLIELINIKVNPVYNISSTDSMCSGNSYKLPWGLIVFKLGTYRDTLKYLQGCDSVIKSVTLIQKSLVFRNISAAICAGDTYTLPWGQVISSPSIYTDTLKFLSGCDSLIETVDVALSSPAYSAIDQNICPGQLYRLPSGKNVNQPGRYIDTLRSIVNGCDSLITSLTLHPASPPLIKLSKSNDVSCSFAISELAASGGERYSWSPSASLSRDDIPNPIANPEITTTYNVKVTTNDGCVGEDTITVYVLGGSAKDFHMPNAFTPNGDGLNDCFGVKHLGNISDLQFAIYSRWGQLIFFTSNSGECWDGTYKGQKLNPDAFVYQISGTTNCGKVHKKGTVALIR